MSDPSSRQVTLVLCSADATVHGALPPFEVAEPFWPQTAPVVARARQLHGVDVTVLRLLRAEPGSGTGGAVTYLAEVADAADADVEPWTGPDPLADHRLRLPWARPAGPAADLAWARLQLARLGLRLREAPQQIRTWNLSSIWRLPTRSGAAWLKVVPPFFAHEGALISRLDPAAVPAVLAFDGPRVLMEELEGQDMFRQSGPVLLAMVDVLVELQSTWSPRVRELLDLGLPDWRAEALPALAARTVAATDLDTGTRHTLDRLLADLPKRLQEVAACGLPDTLVHGDFHPGNAVGLRRGRHLQVRLLDWGDAGVGHPLLDQAAFCQRQPPADQAAAKAHWARLWRQAVPGSAPERAADLLTPVAALRQAVVYQKFLENIEPDERVYHLGDPARWLRRAAERFASETEST